MTEVSRKIKFDPVSDDGLCAFCAAALDLFDDIDVARCATLPDEEASFLDELAFWLLGLDGEQVALLAKDDAGAGGEMEGLA